MQCVDNVQDLGVQLDENLEFMTHINKTIAKAQSKANLVHECLFSKDHAPLKKAFTTYVRSILEFVSSIWSPFLVCAVSKV